jgi:beta-mannosidase
MAIIDLTEEAWQLSGWRPWQWRFNRSMETDTQFNADAGPVPARLPGTVQQALLDAGILEDWHVGVASRYCEWVEHRHWVYRTEFSANQFPEGETVVLEAESLDYAGWIQVNGKEAGRFEGALLPHRFDLTEYITPGATVQFDIIFEEPPREQGQLGFTSQSEHFKPRYNYSWDWCPRFVPIGIQGTLRIVTGLDAQVALKDLRTSLEQDNATGSVSFRLGMNAEALAGNWTCEAILLDGEKETAVNRSPVNEPPLEISMNDIAVTPWQPNGFGGQKLYTLRVRLLDEDGVTGWEESFRIGFRRIEWEACAGAPEDAEPWICKVNGAPVFLQGANWTPARVGCQDTTDEEYERLIGLYRDMGCTCLRVWGGAALESAVFYDACDRAGILVWQEFPLSSSGIDNTPPSDEEALAKLEAIAESYIARRGHHTSLLMWCGGNELMAGEDGVSLGNDRPVTYEHPCIALLRQVAEKHDPDRRFVCTSPSGPQFFAHAENYGKGVHHDTHGPWGMQFWKTLDEWRAYWKADDSLFRSETGMPGASDLALIERYCGGMQVWPPEGPYWQHTAAWWTQRDRYEEALKNLPPEEALARYAEETRQFQAQAYAIAAAACKKRFPACGGFLIWMGHDCFPCPANNSVIDFDRKPKPAYHALKKVFTGKDLS